MLIPTYTFAHIHSQQHPLQILGEPQSEPVVAYRRVSTKSQEESGVGLEAQLQAIEAFASASGFVIAASFQETATGKGNVLVNNRELVRALQHAQKHGLSFVVYDVSRIARDETSVMNICSEWGIPIISASEGGLLSLETLRARAAYAEANGKAISGRTKLGLQKARESGKVLGNRKNLPAAQALGTASNQRRATELVIKIAEFLERQGCPPYPTAAELARSLNALGLLSGRGLLWTKEAIREPYKRAKEYLKKKQDEEVRQIPGFGRFG